MIADLNAIRAELSSLRSEGMPPDRDALQALLNGAYNKGRDDVHALYQTGAPIALLRAELERTTEELERVRRNHLRRMADSIWEAFERIAPMTDERQDDALRKLTRLRDRCRAALERKGEP